MHPLLRHLGRLAVAALLTGAIAPGSLHAAHMLAEPGYRPKDFAFVKKDGVYHLFYIRHNDALPQWATEIDFGHSVSTDLHQWVRLPPVLELDPQGWDNFHVWAPHIVESQGLWWMFYTGVSDRPGFRETQRIGVAVSSDLMTWNRIYQQPVWSTVDSPWAWWQPLSPRMAARDAFVMRDPNAASQWLMYYTATPEVDTVATIVGVARSTGDLGQWTDEKALWITHHSFTFNTSTESPHLFEHNGQWFLFITSNAGQALTFFTSPNPLGEPAEWRYRGRLSTMLGYDTSEWFASEHLKDGTQDLFAFAHSNRIEITRIVWTGPDTFYLESPPQFHMVGMDWSHPTVRENEFVGLTLRSRYGTAFTGELVGRVRTTSAQETSVPLEELGLPARPSLPEDTVQLAWFARRWPQGLPASVPMELRIATADGTASTPWLRIHANAIEQPESPVPVGRAPDQPVDPFTDTLAVETMPPDPTAPDESSLAGGGAPRVLRDSPLGGGPVIAFELAAREHVRVDVFDVTGRRVATLADRTFDRGAHVLPWDSRDLSGQRARRGLYFVRVATTDRVTGTKLFLDR